MTESSPPRYYAHSENAHGEKHLIRKHLMAVSNIISEFSKDTNWEEEAQVCGILHDIGKYSDMFQQRLSGKISGVDHWSPGAWFALQNALVASALAIQGHHIGLQEGSKSSLRGMELAKLATEHPLKIKLSESNIENLKIRLAIDRIKFPFPNSTVINLKEGFQKQISAMFDVRMLFSCLVDADFLDTEAHFEANCNYEKKYRESGPLLDAQKSLEALYDFMGNNIRLFKQPSEIVTLSRNMLWEMVGNQSSNTTGLFTMTAPTGSGKTLAMLRFALEHAKKNNLKRIIIALPFLSIIEQTASEYKKIFQNFPENYVLEHHSLAEILEEDEKKSEEKAKKARQILSENWDAPIIITTNVQILESLFSNRPFACRKLHNLMKSIIIFDEAQTIPQHLAVVTLAALSHLSQTYGTSVVFATATQPAFDTLSENVHKIAGVGWQPTEIVHNKSLLYKNLSRYTVTWPIEGEKKSWENLSNEIKNERQVLCIVNLKNHALEILEKIKDKKGVFYISTNLCPLHRQTLLAEVKERLKENQECRLISTQCVEAGVDIDFPVVYRSLAPLDSIIQAAGRCNREGKLHDKQGNSIVGEVRVFEPAVEGKYYAKYPTMAYYQAAEVTRTMLIENPKGLDINNPDVFHSYYKMLYNVNSPENQSEKLRNAIKSVNFVEVAKEYHLIEKTTIQVLVPYTPHIEKFKMLDTQQMEKGINSKWIREAQGLAVGIYRPHSEHPAWEVLIPAKLRYGAGESMGWYILEDRRKQFYDAQLGLCLPQSQQFLIG